MQAARLRELMGSNPFVTHELATGLFEEHLPENRTELTFESFRRDTHLVTALVDQMGRVHSFAVVSCEEDFKPTITTPVGNIQLRETSMADVGELNRIHYSVGGTGGFGFLVLEGIDGQFNAYRYTDVYWGQIYGLYPESDTANLILPGGALCEQSTYSPCVDKYRRAWQVNLVILTRELPEDAVYSFALDTEMEAYR